LNLKIINKKYYHNKFEMLKFIFGFRSFFLLLFSLLYGSAISQQLSFPGAEGAGRYTSGGRGGSVIEVTNLNDSGAGSLRAAIESSGPRTVVFRVSGNITLYSRLQIKKGDITIAGQTAPGDGICLRGHDFIVDADNVIIRYLRMRLGDEQGVEADAFGGISISDVMIDHCSVSWSVDEAASFYDNIDFTMQWCFITESLKNSVHSKGAHGYGGIWGGMGVSFHHNLLAHHDSRNPRFQGSRGESTPETEIVDHRNNVIYNWDGNSAYGGESGNHNMVANYYKYGPATDSKRNRIIEPSDELGKWYVEDNFVFGYPAVTEDNWNGGVQNVNTSNVRAFVPFPFAPVATHEAETSYELVLADAGHSLKRDTIDARIINEVRTGTATYGGLTGPGTGIIDSQNDVGGWPELLTYDVRIDDDHDGMADDWELANGLSPDDPDDRNGDFNGDGYTNLEKYINGLCIRDNYIVAPAELTALTISDTQIDLTWKENALNESGFSIERSVADTTNFSEITRTDANIVKYSDKDLQKSTKYYYRVRAFNDGHSSLYTNIVFSTTLDTLGPPLPPANPSPADSSEGVNLDTPLQWDPAVGAHSYDLYIGTNDIPGFITNQTSNKYMTEGWKEATTYYWRVDAVNDFGTTAGPLWQFTTKSLPPVLIAHWRMDRGYGTLAVDASGNANHASLINMTEENWVNGIKGTSGIYFNGESQYLSVNNKDIIDFSDGSFSITYWMKSSGSGTMMPVMSKATFDDNIIGAGYQIYMDSNGKIIFKLQDDSTSSVVSTEDIAVNNGDWEFIALIRDKSKKELRIYNNGKISQSAIDSTTDISNANMMYIAGNASGAYFYNGILDDVRIYRNVISDEGIQNLYQDGVTRLSNNGTVIIPGDLSLSNYPNPFNNQTNISYSLPESSNVKLYIYNLLGEIIAEHIEDYKPAGIHTYHFNANYLSSGVYLCRLETGPKSTMTKMILIK
jgi:hypothetical protein